MSFYQANRHHLPPVVLILSPAHWKEVILSWACDRNGSQMTFRLITFAASHPTIFKLKTCHGEQKGYFTAKQAGNLERCKTAESQYIMQVATSRYDGLQSATALEVGRVFFVLPKQKLKAAVKQIITLKFHGTALARQPLGRQTKQQNSYEYAYIQRKLEHCQREVKTEICKAGER